MMTDKHIRRQILEDSSESTKSGARLSQISEILGISTRTLQRWKHSYCDKRPMVKKSSPKSLTTEEKKLIIDTCNKDEFKDMTPNKIVPLLAQRGTYIASESSFYKVLKEQALLNHRANSKQPRPRRKISTLIATKPNQVLSWDITYLKTSIKGIFFYLYLFMDIYSRKIMGWRVEEEESGDYAKQTVEQICLGNDLSDIFIHADNGSPMKCGTLLATFQFLGINASYSRPSVSNDNPYSESLFKTLKYKAGYPDHFDNIEEARKWVDGFVNWYNTEHLHSGIKFVTPDQRHIGADIEILESRKKTYLEAKERTPQRWSRDIKNWSYIDKVELKGSAKLIKSIKIA